MALHRAPSNCKILSMKNKSSLNFISYLAEFLDITGVITISFIVHQIYLEGIPVSREYLISFILTAFLILFIFPNFGIYKSWRGRSKLERARSITIAWATVVLTLVVLSTMLKLTVYYSRVWFYSSSIISVIYLIFYRHILDIALNIARRSGWNHKNVVIFGAGALGNTVASRITEEDWTGFQIKAFFDDDESKTGTILNHIPILSASSISSYIDQNDILELWITLPLRNEARVKELLHELRHLTISIKYIPDIFGFNLLNQEVSEIAGVPILQLNGTPIQGINRVIKEIEDKVFSFFILLLVSPIMLVIAIAIKLESKGPILFKQRRHGWNGDEIKVYKFRSMRVHNEDEGKVTQATRNDDRVTKVGRFIRKTSLDELPQFFNVLQGRMSIVGPRPHALAHNEEYKDRVEYYMQRHKVKPGITGWAQVNGLRGETDTIEKMTKRVEYDLFYIENWSLWFDIRIIAKTILTGFIDDNAY